MPCSEARYSHRLTRANTGDRVIAGRGTACLGRQIMACTLHVAWDDRLAGYDFGAGHPMPPVRLELTIELARAFGLFAAAGYRSSARRPPLTRNWGWRTSSRTSLRCGGRAARSRALRRWNSAWEPRTTRCSRACMTRRR